MSVHNKVKVIWKTNCQWRDQPHWFKRKDIKLNNDNILSEGKQLASLKPGDAVKVKFGLRWYNAEVCEEWEPKQSKKRKYICFNCTLL